MTEQQSFPKRHPGRPSSGKDRKPSLNVTISQEVADFLREYGKDHNVSGFIDGLVKSSPQYRASQQ